MNLRNFLEWFKPHTTTSETRRLLERGLVAQINDSWSPDPTMNFNYEGQLPRGIAGIRADGNRWAYGEPYLLFEDPIDVELMGDATKKVFRKVRIEPNDHGHEIYSGNLAMPLFFIRGSGTKMFYYDWDHPREVAEIVEKYLEQKYSTLAMSANRG